MAWTPEEQREHRKQWVEALRSGKYRQTSQALHRSGGFCCLGVACEVSGLGEWGSPEVDGKVPYITDGRRDENYLPDALIGLSGYNPIVPCEGLSTFEDGRSSIGALNDSGATFAELADIIESEPEGLLSSPEAA